MPGDTRQLTGPKRLEDEPHYWPQPSETPIRRSGAPTVAARLCAAGKLVGPQVRVT